MFMLRIVNLNIWLPLQAVH